VVDGRCSADRTVEEDLVCVGRDGLVHRRPGGPVTDQPVTDEPVTDEPTESAERADQIPAPTATAVLTHVVRSIVDDADAVRVDAVEGKNRLKLEVKVGPGDLGRVIGRRGRTAQSIRTVVRAAATRDGVDVDVDFVD
jgi:predicted RNA-binding protein YlqC (UPF0109 family)